MVFGYSSKTVLNAMVKAMKWNIGLVPVTTEKNE